MSDESSVSKMETVILKPCPFCGGEPHLYVGLANGLTCRVRCESCGIMTEIGGKEVIDDWNRRASE